MCYPILMLPTRDGALRLFRFSGIEVFLHWSWFLVGAWEIQHRRLEYSSLTWNILEYLSLFLIVLLHEFGHAFACRQVGGRADQIVLWPLGGVAYVDPPPRPGAVLWSIAAGPLVNVVLMPLIVGAWYLGRTSGWAEASPDAFGLLRMVMLINAGILIFNLLPVYPLDGGQILRALLWFPLGPARSLLIASGIGFIGVAALVALAVWQQSIWTGIMAAFVFMSCRRGWQQAQALMAHMRERERSGG